MSAAALKERLRADLKAAMRARSVDEVGVLRTLIAALDNAEAVAVENREEDKFAVRRVGDPSVEVARRELDDAAIERLLAAETQARLAAAADYERHGQDEAASRLRGETAVIARYRAD